ncbi:hypothetical protein [Herbiconiux sp. VKM Ac-2851]|uniref:hypothetical protein n=1 Tax=Herbiconiux sp. VKM Ac-2851 TaxID=2739025 RepID=UPI001566AE88|nr:hypothetical protein [Herbiconiux sp. VKM Ac-2851]NQX36608.1 hypothetical protein [Herbiconiux sp. VKM Ac-2851]
MAHRIDLPPHLTSRPFALGEALSAGVGESRLLGSDLDVPFRGVRAPASPGDLMALCQAFARSTVGGLPVVDPVSAWLQLAGGSTLDELVVAGDHLVRIPARRDDLRRPFCTVDELVQRSRECRGRGATLARRAAELVREGSDSPQESRLRLALTRAGLPEAVRLVRAALAAHPESSWP